MPDVVIRPTTEQDQARVRQFMIDHWGAPIVVVHDTTYTPHELLGLVALQDGELIGLLTYHIQDASCEIVTLDSVRSGNGVGTALVNAAREAAANAGCTRLWLITTNDNLNALRFYQKRGFVLVAIHRDAVTRARLRKPQIPLVGDYGIPLRDEIELESLIE